MPRARKLTAGSTGSEKTHNARRFVTGHDFSRALEFLHLPWTILS